MVCHTWIQAVDRNRCRTLLQCYHDSGPTSPSTDPITQETGEICNYTTKMSVQCDLMYLRKF